MATNNKYIRIELMVEEDDKTLLEEASACKGVSLNRYIIFAAMKDAKEDAAEEEQLVLSSSDRAIVMDTLEEAPEPNAHLKGLFKR